MKKRKGLSLIYLNNFLRGLGFSLVGIFIPIYFLTLGYTLNQVFLYFLIFHLVTFILTPLTLLLSRKFGYKPIIIASTPFVILFLLSLIYIKELSIPLYVIALFLAIQEIFFYLPLHSYFTRLTQDNKRGTQFSKYDSIGMIAGLISPLIGAFIAIVFGFSNLFYFAIVFFVLSIIPLLYIQNIMPITKIHHKNIHRLAKDYKHFFFATFFFNIKDNTEGIIWPIFVFLTIKSIISIGYISVLAAIGAILFNLFIGKSHDRNNKYFYLKLSAVLYFFVWMLRVFIELPIFIYVITLATGFIAIMMNIPYNAIFYDKASAHKDKDEFILFTEIPNFIGRAFLWIIMILVSSKFTTAFVLSAIACLYFVFFKMEKSENR